MYFEGSEKKLEIVVNPAVGPLRSWPRSFWNKLVQSAGAQIISKISSERLDAYLLSESSLFVWDDRITMITCGNTALVGAAEFFLQQVSQDQLEVLVFERKNEYFPHRQHSDFFDDIERLSKLVHGRAFRFGEANEHHLFLFHLNKHYNPRETDRTLEILMYGLQGEAKEVFSRTEGSEREFINKLMTDVSVFSGFKVDDHVFEPIGYSLNAVRGDEYFTIHVTPQELSPYVSFETSLESSESFAEIIQAVIAAFKPKSFDLVEFQTEEPVFLSIPDYHCRDKLRQDLNCGYKVGFSTYGLPRETVREAYPIQPFG